ncbi:MAG: glycosyltransferase family 4 protein [Candidatus Omnitrophota bacterium]
MKILHLTNHLNTGGITTYILTLAGEQVKAGHDVFVWGGQGRCSEDLKARGIIVLDDVPCCKSELSPRLWSTLPKLIRILKTHSIDIIHTHTRVTQVLASGATFFVKIPYVSTAHMFYKRRLGRRLFPCWGNAVIAISKVMEEGLRTIFKKKELPPITVVSNGIDVEKLSAKFDGVDRGKIRESYGYRNEDFVILSLCRLIPVKGVHILIEAFVVARKEVPEMKLLVAGAGDPVYTQGLKDRVAALHLERDVLFIGNEPEIEKPLRAADIFVAPYLWPEAFGLSVLESMAVGLPVVGSLSGGIVDLLGHGKYGLLYERENIAELAACLVRYAREKPLRSAMGKAARQAALEYTSFQMCERIQKVYAYVLKKRA